MEFLMAFVVFGVSMADIHRSKRFLIFPPTSPTRMQVIYATVFISIFINEPTFLQIIAGIGVPVQLDYESVTMGYTFKAEYFVQDNVTIAEHFFQTPFNPIPHPIQNRRRRHALLLASNQHMETLDPIEVEMNKMETNSLSDDHYEKYDVEAIEIDSGLTGNDNGDDADYGDETEEHEEDHPATNNYWNTNQHKDFSTARWTLFKGIELLARRLVITFPNFLFYFCFVINLTRFRKGLAGRPCMLRSICESAQAPFSIKTGILGELMHIVMT